jgi:hypothetical protein
MHETAFASTSKKKDDKSLILRIARKLSEVDKGRKLNAFDEEKSRVFILLSSVLQLDRDVSGTLDR